MDKSPDRLLEAYYRYVLPCVNLHGGHTDDTTLRMTSKRYADAEATAHVALAKRPVASTIRM